MPPFTVASLATTITSRPLDAADAGDEAGRRRLALVHVPGGQRRQLEPRRAGVEQPVDALAHRQLALLAVALERPLAAAAAGLGQPLAQLGDEALAGAPGSRGTAPNPSADASR